MRKTAELVRVFKSHHTSGVRAVSCQDFSFVLNVGKKAFVAFFEDSLAQGFWKLHWVLPFQPVFLVMDRIALSDKKLFGMQRRGGIKTMSELELRIFHWEGLGKPGPLLYLERNLKAQSESVGFREVLGISP